MSESQPFVLYFTLPVCAPCQRMLPLVTAECQKRKLGLEVLDAVADTHMTARYDVRRVPTLILIDGQRVLGTLSFGASARTLKRWLDEHLDDNTPGTSPGLQGPVGTRPGRVPGSDPSG